MKRKFKDERQDLLERKEKGYKNKDNRQTLKSHVIIFLQKEGQGKRFQEG